MTLWVHFNAIRNCAKIAWRPPFKFFCVFLKLVWSSNSLILNERARCQTRFADGSIWKVHIHSHCTRFTRLPKAVSLAVRHEWFPPLMSWRRKQIIIMNMIKIKMDLNLTHSACRSLGRRKVKDSYLVSRPGQKVCKRHAFPLSNDAERVRTWIVHFTPKHPLRFPSVSGNLESRVKHWMPGT